MFFFSRVNHASMSLWDENSTSLLYSHIPSSARTWRIFPNMLCQCFFPFSWHFKREKSVFWKASFFAIQELMTLARIRVKDFATGENKFSKHWRHQILQGPLESLYKASCWDCKDFYNGKLTKLSWEESFFKQLRCWENTRKACKSSFNRVLPTSRVAYRGGKPIESVVYCFYKITTSKTEFSRVYRHNKP